MTWDATQIERIEAIWSIYRSTLVRAHYTYRTVKLNVLQAEDLNLAPGVEPGNADRPPCFQIVEVNGPGGGQGPRYTVDVPDKSLWMKKLYAVQGCVQCLPELENCIMQICEYETRRRERRNSLWNLSGDAGKANDPHHQFCFELKTFLVCQLAPFYEESVTPALKALLQRRIEYLDCIGSSDNIDNMFPSKLDGKRNLEAIIKNVREQLQSVLRKVSALTGSVTLTINLL